MGKARPDGDLAPVHPVDLLAQVLTGLLEQTGLEPDLVDDVMVGCVTQSGEQAGNVGRMAWLAANLPEHVPAVTIERKCGSGQQAIQFAVAAVAAGHSEIVIAAGVESMGRVPLGSNRMGADIAGPSVTRRYSPGLVAQGVSAELIADRWGIERGELDAFSARSHQRAAAADRAGEFAAEIIPILADGRMISRDSTIRPDTNAGSLAKLKPVFATEEMEARFPELAWSVTAGSSSQMTDGASAVLIMSARRAAQLGLPQRARFRAFNVCGDDPILMLTAPIPATRAVLERAGMSVDEIDHFEVNEAFASIPIAWQREFGVPDERLNPRGGAIALGHPLGASGCRLLTTMLRTLEDREQRFGLQVMCEAGGMANAMIVERL